MDAIKTFMRRMERLGIMIELSVNYPWVYIKKINGMVVKERYLGNHGFTIAFLPIKDGQSINFTDTGVIFNLIRKYVNKNKSHSN